jgi:hypothetical protein
MKAAQTHACAEEDADQHAVSEFMPVHRIDTHATTTRRINTAHNPMRQKAAAPAQARSGFSSPVFLPHNLRWGQDSCGWALRHSRSFVQRSQ